MDMKLNFSYIAVSINKSTAIQKINATFLECVSMTL
jgi:hypothetical protein